MNYLEELAAERATIETAIEEVAQVLKRYFPKPHGNLNVPQVLAACIGLFDIGDKKNAGQLYLEWTLDHFVGLKVAANIDEIKMLVEALKFHGYTEDNPYIYNDCDNRLFYIPHKTKLIFCSESQNNRFIFIYDSRGRLHVRRYFDEYDFAGEKDEWEHEDEEMFRRDGIKEAIKTADWLTERWSDYIPGNQFPNRPSLAYFKDGNFEQLYQDCRDIGYVLSYENLHTPRVDMAAYNYADIKMAFFEMRCAIEEAETGFEGH